MAITIESTLYIDQQAATPSGFCPNCGGEVYAPGNSCLRCARRFLTLSEMSADYEASAALLRARLKLLRQKLAQADDSEEIWHLQRRIAELTPMLTQMNELADLTAHYYERGYWRNEKYTL